MNLIEIVYGNKFRLHLILKFQIATAYPCLKRIIYFEEISQVFLDKNKIHMSEHLRILVNQSWGEKHTYHLRHTD